MRSFAALLILVFVSGCAQAPRTPQPVVYACDGGKQFAFTPVGSDGAAVEFAGMRFSLLRDSAGAGDRFSCEVLSVTLEGTRAAMTVEGRPAYANCRVVEK